MMDSHKTGDSVSRHHGLRVSELWRILGYRRYMVLLILSLSVLGTFLGHFVYTPTYPATSRISVQTEQPKSIAQYLGSEANLWSNHSYAERIHNYQQFLKSSSFLLKVAQVLKFSPSTEPLVFEAVKKLSLFDAEFWQVMMANMTETPRSHSRRPPEELDTLTKPVEDIAEFIASVMSVKSNDVDTISITIKTLDSFTSMRIANTIANEFTKITNQHDARGLLEVKKLLEEKLEATKEKLKEAEIELVEFKKENRISGSTTQSAFYSNRLNDIEKEVEKIKLKLAENEKLIAFYENTQKNQLRDALNAADGGSRTHAQSQLVVLNQRLDGLRQQKSLMLAQKYPNDHWRIQKIDQEVSAVAGELKELLAKNPQLKGAEFGTSGNRLLSKISSLKEENRLAKNKLVPLEKSRKELMSVLEKVPQAEQSQLMLERKLNLEYENFSTLHKKLNEVEIQLVSLDKKVLIDRLSMRPKPAKRRSLWLKLLFSALVGSFFGGMVALLLDYVDSSVRRKSDLEDLGVHFLGEIPEMSNPGERTPLVGMKSPAQIVTLNQPDSIDSIVFDFVRSRLESTRTRSGKTSNSITITSVRPGDGKSFIAANLAVSLAHLGKRTLLLDCDLRNPSVHCYFDIPNNHGLVDLFESDASLDDMMQTEVTSNLDILTAGWGSKAPTVLISSEKFRFLVRHLRNEYDYVVIDTPPVSAVADASILSNMTDSVVLVSRYRDTTRHDITDAQFKINQMSNKRIHGIINFARNRDDIVTYYPYFVSRPERQGKDFSHHKKEDLVRFEEQLKRKRSG